MLYRFTGFCSFNGKEFDSKNRILIEANSDEDAKSVAYNKLKKLCGVKPTGQFRVQRLEVERQYTEQELNEMNYRAEVEQSRQDYVEQQQVGDVQIPFTDFEEETPKKTTRKKKTEQTEP